MAEAMTRAWEPVEPLTAEPEQVAYWQEFKVGDRVRVRLSGECPLRLVPLAPDANVHAPDEDMVNGPYEGHHANGAIGIILTRLTDSASYGSGLAEHYYVVYFEEPQPWPAQPGQLLFAESYAACELEPEPVP
jgi:hypothetical protein